MAELMPESETVAVVGPDGEQLELTAEQLQALEDEAERLRAEKQERVNALGASLAIKRKEAILFRRQSGVENEWDEDDDAYEGVDEVSKQESSAFRSRPAGQFTVNDKKETRSSVVLNITKPYVNAFASKIIDMRLQAQDRTWAFRPTPVPQIEEMKKSPRTVMVDGQTMPEAQLAEEIIANAAQAAEKAQKRVDDWLVESAWQGEARQAIDDMARIGTGVLKGPMPEKCIYTVYKTGALTQVESIEPKSRRISARNLFPDPACGENVHDGDYIWEVDYLTAKRLADLKDMPGYLPDEIDAALTEGPRSPEVEYDPNKPMPVDQKSKPFQVWYFTGRLKKEDIEAAGCECEDENESVAVMVAMVNDHVIRASLNPLDNGKFPYDVAPCSRREGHWAGIGIARELRTPQRMITGAVRQMMMNAGLSSGPQIILKRGVVSPATPGDYSITPLKIWYADPNADPQAVRDSFMAINIDCRQGELMGIIQFALKMAEDVTGLPMILQGQQGKAPDILGVVQILNENATSVARRVAKMFDDNIIEPHIGRYYDWLMQYGENDEEKGDYTIDVLTPPDMAVDSQAIADMGQMAMNPAFGVDPKKFFAEVAKAKRFDPKRIQYTDEEWKKLQEQPQPKDPRLAVAELNAQVKMQEGEKDRRFEMIRMAMEAELSQADQEGAKAISTDKLKAMLAQTAVVETNKRELYADEKRLKLATGQGI